MIVNSHENFGPDIGYAKNNKNTWYSLCETVFSMVIVYFLQYTLYKYVMSKNSGTPGR